MLSMGIQYHPYTVIPTLLGSDFGVLGHLWCQPQVSDFAMVDADSHLKLLPTSILDVYKVFEPFDMLLIGIWVHPYTVLPTLLGSDFGVLGHLWSQNDVNTSGLMLTATSNCFPPPS
jgi:hypothetical protein